MTDDQIKSYALVEIEKVLRSLGKCVRDSEGMPFPNSEFFENEGNRLIIDEIRYDRSSLAEEHQILVYKLTDEQHNVYTTIMNAVNSGGGVFFVYGYGGTGKTFIWKTLSSALRSKSEIVLNVASSGIASLLLPGGRTAHSRFRIPINVNEDTTCNIKQGSPLVELIVRSKLIIWDEAPMTHKHCFEALDRTLGDIMRHVDSSTESKPFGGKTVVFGGDFRQILPVISKGTRQNIVSSAINSSYLWRHCKVLRLTKNMRLNQIRRTDEALEIENFSIWIADIGDGILGGQNDGYAQIDLPEDVLIKCSGDPIASIVDSTYPSYSADFADMSYLQERAILAPTLDIVESVNQRMVSMNCGERQLYQSSDTTCKSDSNSDLFEQVHTPELLNSITSSGIPNHELYLKVRTPVMLLRNIDHASGLCNGTRLMITRLGNRVLEAKLLTGDNAEQKY